MSKLNLLTELEHVTVSTVYLGRPDNPHGIPVIGRSMWETLVFTKEGRALFEKHYASEEEARAGHEETVHMYSKAE